MTGATGRILSMQLQALAHGGGDDLAAVAIDVRLDAGRRIRRRCAQQAAQYPRAPDAGMRVEVTVRCRGPAPPPVRVGERPSATRGRLPPMPVLRRRRSGSVIGGQRPVTGRSPERPADQRARFADEGLAQALVETSASGVTVDNSPRYSHWPAKVSTGPAPRSASCDAPAPPAPAGATSRPPQDRSAPTSGMLIRGRTKPRGQLQIADGAGAGIDTSRSGTGNAIDQDARQSLLDAGFKTALGVARRRTAMTARSAGAAGAERATGPSTMICCAGAPADGWVRCAAGWSARAGGVEKSAISIRSMPFCRLGAE
jgi:hypothetical protein